MRRGDSLEDDESSVTGTVTSVLLGAVAGFAVGMLVAQRVGGFSGLADKVRRRRTVEDEAALTDCQVGLTGVSADGGVNASAAVLSAASLLFTDWYAEMTTVSFETAVFRLVCGRAAP